MQVEDQVEDFVLLLQLEHQEEVEQVEEMEVQQEQQEQPTQVVEQELVD